MPNKLATTPIFQPGSMLRRIRMGNTPRKGASAELSSSSPPRDDYSHSLTWMSKPDIARSLRERHGITKARNEDDKKLCVLTYNQQSLWFMQEVDPTRVDYVVHWCAAVKETLDVEALRCAFQSLSDIHPSLRTTYDDENGMPYQIVHRTPVISNCWRSVECGRNRAA